MALGTITVGTLGVIGSASYLIRRRISRGWIDCRSKTCNLSGKTIVITGGNVGLGYEAAKDLVGRNAKVVLACRNIEKAREAAQTIKESTNSNGSIDVLELDLASLQSVREFSTAIKQQYTKIDVLVCNAGVWVPMDQHQKTKDGLEIHFGVNHLGHFALVQDLMDCINDRVVIVSSGLRKFGKLDFDKKDFVKDGRVADPEKKSFAPTGYCDSKLMNAFMCKSLSEKGVNTVAICPGFCRSSLARSVKFAWYKKLMLAPIVKVVQRSTVQGAQNVIFGVIEPSLESGGFYRDGKIAKEESEYVQSLGEDAPRQLWELSEQLVKKILEEK